MILSLPSFKRVILLQKSEGEENSLLLTTLLNLLEHLSVLPLNTTEAPIEEILSLLEILLSDIPDETINQFVSFNPRRFTC
jgi:hypothetical protein